MPQVVGALVAGIVLGPSFLGIISLEGTTGTFLECIAEVGVIFLMFSAGLGTDLSELKENWLGAFIVATVGVIVPVLGGFAGYALFFHVPLNEYTECLKAVFVGVVLSATSVSITVETLRELGRLKGKVGTTILAAAADRRYFRHHCPHYRYQPAGFQCTYQYCSDKDCSLFCNDRGHRFCGLQIPVVSANAAISFEELRFSPSLSA